MVQETMAPNDVMDSAAFIESAAPSTSNTRVIDEYDEFVENPILYTAASWSPTSINTVLTEDLYQDFLTRAVAGSYLAKKLTNFAFVNGHLRVRIVVQGASQAFGKLVFSFDPNPYTGTATTLLPAAQRTRGMLIPHIEIDPSTSAVYTIDLPPTSVFGVFSNYVGAHNARFSLGSYRLKQHVVNALSSGSAALPDVGVTLYLSLVSPKVSTATANALFTLTSLVKEKTSPTGGVLSSGLSKAAKLASVVGKLPIPGLAEGANLFSSAAGTASSFLHWMGYSKPLEIDRGFTSITNNNNWTKIDNKLRSDLLSLRTDYSLGISPDLVPLAKMEDMVVSNLCSRPGLVAIHTVLPAAAPGALIGSIIANPMLSLVLADPAVVNGYELTPLAFCAFPYKFWRGTIDVDVEIVASVFHRCTVMAIFDPYPGTTTNLLERAAILPHWTFQVSGSSKHRITLPWKVAELALVVGSPGVTPTGTSSGTLYYVLLNPVISNGSTDGIFINTYFSSSEMRFAYPLRKDFTLTSSSRPLSSIPGNDLFLQTFGEEHAHSIKELASRATICAVANPTTTVNPDATTVISFASVPLVGNMNLPSGPTGFTKGNSLLDFLSLAYVGVRGSTNFSVGFNTFENGVPRCNISMADSVAHLVFSGPLTLSIIPYTWEPFTDCISRVNQIVDFTIPQINIGLYVPTFASYVGNVAPGWRGRFITNLATTYRWPILKSAGDDYMFVGFRGVPTMVYA